MVERGVVQCRTGTANCSGTGLSCGKYKALYPRMDHRTAAHRAGLQRHIKGCTREPIVAVPDSSLSQYPDFRMGSGVVKLYLRVTAMREHHLVARQHRTHRHFTAICGATRLFQSQSHAALIPLTETHSGASL